MTKCCPLSHIFVPLFSALKLVSSIKLVYRSHILRGASNLLLNAYTMMDTLEIVGNFRRSIINCAFLHIVFFIFYFGRYKLHLYSIKHIFVPLFSALKLVSSIKLVYRSHILRGASNLLLNAYTMMDTLEIVGNFRRSIINCAFLYIVFCIFYFGRYKLHLSSIKLHVRIALNVLSISSKSKYSYCAFQIFHIFLAVYVKFMQFLVHTIYISYSIH